MLRTLALLSLVACGGAEPAQDPVLDGAVPEPVAADAPAMPPLPQPAAVPYAVQGLDNGAYAPEIALPDARTGKPPFRLSDHVGPARTQPTRAAIVSFSASWCGPCQASLPQLAELKAEYGDELLVLIVSIDESEAGLRREVAAIERAGLDAPVVHAPEALQRAWLGDTRNIPHMYVLNQVGEVLVQDRGYGENVARVLPAQVRFAHGNPQYVER
jgi:thiol-disulfide isomerase/thioredoxin